MMRFSRIAMLAALAVVAATGSAAAEQWHIKCFDTDGRTIAVKALSADTDTFDVKAIGTGDPERHDVKALHLATGAQLAVKVVAAQDEGAAYEDVKAIAEGGRLIGIKAITASGDILPVKAFHDEATGRYDIKCLRGDKKLGLKAISPSGRVYDVKGIKDLPDQGEIEVDVLAHIKAVPQERPPEKLQD